MTPEHRLAIQIMDECGKTPQQIVADPEWLEPVTVDQVNRVLEPMSRNTWNHFLYMDGEKRTVTEWAKITGLPRRLIHTRLKRGWTVKETLTTEPRK